MSPNSIERTNQVKKAYAAFILGNHIIRTKSLLIAFAVGYCYENKLMKNSRTIKKRIKRTEWSSIVDELTEAKFRRMFRVTKECFDHLCNKIQEVVGIHVFKSEEYLKSIFLDNIKKTHSSRLKNANQTRYNGYISGQIKLAITLRLLAGASYLDLEVIFKISSQSIYTIFHDVLSNWICNDDIIKIEFYNQATDLNQMKETALCFANGSSNGIMGGCIGALDGWLVKMNCPSIKKDNVQNVSNFYSRKGFFALNVQVIVDKHKQVLWHSIKCNGAEHDSSAFKVTSLYKILTKKYQWFIENGLYLVGDSAYALRPFLITPFDNAKAGTKEDAFNYHLSSCRIYVECAFGEMYKRWGILWRPLAFRLQHNMKIIDSVLRLHNYIIQYEMDNDIRTFDRNDDMFINMEMSRFFSANIDNFVGIFTDDEVANEEDDMSSNHMNKMLLQLGKDLRDKICDAMESDGLRRSVRTIRRDEFNIVQDLS